MGLAFEFSHYNGRLLLRSPAGRSFEVDIDEADFEKRLAENDTDLLGALSDAGCVTGPGTTVEMLRLETATPLTRSNAQIIADPSWSSAATWLAQHLGGRLSAQPDLGSERLHVVMLDGYDPERLADFDQRFIASGTPWLPVYLADGSAWIGPLITPGRTADYRDLLARRQAAAKGNPLAELELTLQPASASVPASAAERAWVTAEIALRLQRTLAGAPGALTATELELSLRTLSHQEHPVLPLPERFPNNYSVRHVRNDLVDLRTGVITELEKIEHHESVPARLRTIQSRVSDIHTFSTFSNNNTALGSVFDDEESATGAAIGEAIERICGNYVLPGSTFKSSERRLRSEGTPVLSPNELELFSAPQYADAGFPFKPWSDDEEVSWTWMRDLATGQEVAVPAFAVYINWYGDLGRHEIPHQYMSYPGISAGATLQSAIVSGLEEIVERDATMVWWLSNVTIPRLRVPEPLGEYWEGRPRELGQRPSLISIPNEFAIPVVGGILYNEREDLLNVGFAARPTAREAALKAWAEALTLQDGSRDLLIPDGLWHKDQAEGPFPMENFKAWRSDRRYTDDYRADCRDVNDLMCQQQYHLDPVGQRRVAHMLNGPETMDINEVPSLPDRSLDTYRERIESAGYRILVADLTTPDARTCGIHVVRTIVPGLVPNTPAAFPPLGNGRVLDEAVRLGLRPARASLDELNYQPLPHA